MFARLRAACPVFLAVPATGASREPPEEARQTAPGEGSRWPWLQAVYPWLASAVLHAWILLALALLLVAADVVSVQPSLTAIVAEPAAELDVIVVQPEPIEHLARRIDPLPSESHAVEVGPIALAEGDAAHRRSASAAMLPLEGIDPLAPLGNPGGGLQGRSPQARALLVRQRGGSTESEQAVQRGLRWLMAHQLDDGSWRLNHHLSPQCRGQCRHPGNVGSTTAATALALLPFLGAGSTHLEGEYRQAVSRGIYYLAGRMRLSERGGDLQEGTMYAQGLSTIALCEAYAMSKDESLREPAQAAVDFIVRAQHPAGGWRYLPGQPGDTTSLGWQLMALKSAQMAGLKVPPSTMYGAAHFLDGVEMHGGVYYGYQRPERRPTTTAIGLLCRMYLGWPRERQALGQGVYYLLDLGPSPDNMYFNYYAAQVLNHYEADGWPEWNLKLREHLIRTQATEGHEAGSWQFDDEHTKTAGRVYNTAMAVMILEVYYRHMPLYSAQALDFE